MWIRGTWLLNRQLCPGCSGPGSEGPHAWGLMLCGCCLGILLSMNLCFVCEGYWDSGACARGLEHSLALTPSPGTSSGPAPYPWHPRWEPSQPKPSLLCAVIQGKSPECGLHGGSKRRRREPFLTSQLTGPLALTPHLQGPERTASWGSCENATGQSSTTILLPVAPPPRG